MDSFEDFEDGQDEEWKDENALRDTADWLKAIGPEELDRETVMKNLEEYGFETFNEDNNFVSSPLMNQDMPDWASPEADTYDNEPGKDLSLRVNGSTTLTDRPVEDEVLDRLTDDDDDEEGIAGAGTTS